MEEAGELAAALLNNDKPEIVDAIGDIVVVLTNLAKLEGFDIENCVDSAYNEIANRTGVMHNGTFVKTGIKANTMKINTKDEIVLSVLKKMDQRSIIGQEKYGATMMQEIEGQEKDLNRFLVDVQEELMDALLYIEAAKRCLSDEIEEAMINRINVVGQNGNDGLHYHDIEVNEQETL